MALATAAEARGGSGDASNRNDTAAAALMAQLSPPAPAASAGPAHAGGHDEALSGLTGVQRIAALLVGLGPEAATAVLKHLKEEHVEQVTIELFRMRQVSSKVTDAVINEVHDMLIASDYAQSGGLEYAQELITRTYGAERAAELINRIAARIRKGPFDFLRDVDPMQLVSFLQAEHPQTIALVLSHLRPEQAAMVLTGLHPESQTDVAMRIATMDRTAPEVVKEVERLLKDKLASVGTQNTQLVGGVKHLVDLLNATDTTSQKTIVDALDETQPELADEIKKNMFVFEDIAQLSDRDMQRVVRELDTKDLAIALRGATEELKNKFFKGMSGRAAQQLNEDIELLGPQRIQTIDDAQQKIVANIRRLEAAEEITVARGGKEEFR